MAAMWIVAQSGVPQAADFAVTNGIGTPVIINTLTDTAYYYNGTAVVQIAPSRPTGGAVTQLTSRTTGVTLNRMAGAITMFSAAGSATAATFIVTNSLVGANDTIVLNQKSGTNLYNLNVTTVNAGSFNVTFYTTGGTVSDAPVINFTVQRGAVS